MLQYDVTGDAGGSDGAARSKSEDSRHGSPKAAGPVNQKFVKQLLRDLMRRFF